MKINNFNKLYNYNFGKNPIQAHLAFANWYIENEYEISNALNQQEANDLFKAWAQQEGFANYSSTDKTDYLSRILDNTIKIYKFLKQNKEGGLELDCDLNNVENSVVNKMTLQYKKAIDLVLNKWSSKMSDQEANDFADSFKAMLDFMIAHPEKNDARKIYQAFAVFEKGDNFEDYYNLTQEDFLNKIVNKQIPTNGGEEFFKKQNKGNFGILCDEIRNSKTNNSNISITLFKTLKNSYLSSFKSKEEFQDFIKNNSYDTIARKLQYNYLKNKIYNINFPEFTKVMKALNLSKTQGSTTMVFENDNLEFKNGQYNIKNLLKQEKLPFNEKEVNAYLDFIKNNDFSFKQNINAINTKTDESLLEYFVNLKILSVSGKEYNSANYEKLANTFLSCDNYPTMPAPKGVPDMKFETKDGYTIFETTKHFKKADIVSAEFNGILHHAVNSDKKNINIVLISNTKNKESIKKEFDFACRPVLSKQHKKVKFVILDINEVKNLDKEKFKSLVDSNIKKYPPAQR